MRESMEKGRMVRISRKSSIETEPRTLNFDQIQNAREAALNVANTMSTEEAMHIFTEGLEPVVQAVGDNGGGCVDWDEEEHGGTAVAAFRDVASAPF